MVRIIGPIKYEPYVLFALCCVKNKVRRNSKNWNPYIPARHYLGMTDQVEKVQRYFTRRVYQRCQLNCNHSYLQRLTYLKIESLELRRIYLELAMVHKSIRGLITADINQHFSFAIQASESAVRARGHPFKLKTTRCRLKAKKISIFIYTHQLHYTPLHNFTI